jgi:hypothetical protein
MSALGSGSQSEKSTETEPCEIPVEPGAIARYAYLVPDTFGTDMDHLRNALKNAPSLPLFMGGGRGEPSRFPPLWGTNVHVRTYIAPYDEREMVRSNGSFK